MRMFAAWICVGPLLLWSGACLAAQDPVKQPAAILRVDPLEKLEWVLTGLFVDVEGDQELAWWRDQPQVKAWEQQLSWLDRTRPTLVATNGVDYLSYVPVRQPAKLVELLDQLLGPAQRGTYRTRGVEVRLSRDKRWVLSGSKLDPFPDEPNEWLALADPAYSLHGRVWLDRLPEGVKATLLAYGRMFAGFGGDDGQPGLGLLMDQIEAWFTNATRVANDLQELHLKLNLNREALTAGVKVAVDPQSATGRRFAEYARLTSGLGGIHQPETEFSMLLRTQLPERNRDRIFVWAESMRKSISSQFATEMSVAEARAVEDILALMGGEDLDVGLGLWRSPDGNTGALVLGFRSFDAVRMRTRLTELRRVVGQARRKGVTWRRHAVGDAEFFELPQAAPEFPLAQRGSRMDIVVGGGEGLAILAVGNECLSHVKRTYLSSQKSREQVQPLLKLRFGTYNLFESSLREWNAPPKMKVDPNAAWILESLHRDEVTLRMEAKPGEAELHFEVGQFPLRLSVLGLKLLLQDMMGDRGDR